MVSHFLVLRILALIWRYIKQWDSMELSVQNVCSRSGLGYYTVFTSGISASLVTVRWFLSVRGGHRLGGGWIYGRGYEKSYGWFWLYRISKIPGVLYSSLHLS